MNARRLFRSRTDRAITGIAGGMAEYLEVDPTVVRILWVLAAIFSGGLAILLYIVLAFVIPLNPYQPGAAPGGGWSAGPGPAWGPTPTDPPAAGTPDAGAPVASYVTGYGSGYAAGGAPAWNAGWNAEYERSRAARAERPGRTGLIIGTVLIVFGAIALADTVVPGWLGGALVVPGLLVALGVGLLVASLRGSREHTAPAGAPPTPAGFASAAPPAAPPAGSSTASAPEADAAGAAYEDDATTSLPPQPGADRA